MSVNFFDACATDGCIDIVSGILQKDATGVMRQNSTGRTGLMCAVYANNFPVVTLLLNSKSDPNMAEFQRSYTALHFAVGRNYPIIVQTLLKNNANPNVLGVDGKTPLHLAIEQNLLPISKILISEGANVHITSPAFPSSPLKLAETSAPEIFLAMQQNKDDKDDSEEGEEEEEENNDDEEDDDLEGTESEEDEENDEEEEEEDDNTDEENSDEIEENDNIEEEPIVEITSGEIHPRTHPKLFVCAQCGKPLESEIWQCAFGPHFLCGCCHGKRFAAFREGARPCTKSSCHGKNSTTWSRNQNLEIQLQASLEPCGQGCEHKYLPELIDVHRQQCFKGDQICNFCSALVEQSTYVEHLESTCLGGFERIPATLKLTNKRNSQYLLCEKSALLLGDKNCFCHFNFTSVDGEQSNIHPRMILAVHPSQSKKGWQVWLSIDTSSLPVHDIPSSLSSKFKCVLYQSYEGVEYQFSVPISPLGYVKWAYVPSLLLFNRPPPVKLNMELVGFKAFS